MISDSSAGGIVKGVADIAGAALKTIIGTGEGSEQETKLYCVVADYPAIVRFVFAFWARKIQAASIKKHIETAMACVAYKSAVDVKKLAFNDFLTLYGPILNKGFGGDRIKIKDMIENAKEIYAMFTNDLPLQGTDQLLTTINTEPRGIWIGASAPATEGDF